MSKVEKKNLDTSESSSISNVEEFMFTQKPIRGFPELRWTGKRTYTSTLYYPAQLKEVYGTEIDGWRNKLYWGDNMQVMSHLIKEFRGKINFIYIDPPYDSKADYKKKVTLRGETITNDHTSFEEKQYSDIWTNDEYLQFMYERLILARELLSDDGSIFLHCDWHKSHHLRCLLDEVFGNGLPDGSGPGYKNEIIWCYSIGGKSKSKFAEKHDTIFWYSKTGRYIFNPDGAKIPRKLNTHMKISLDEDGREYQVKRDKKSGKEYIYYVDEGKVAEDYWTDIETLNREDAERSNYPTQKPEKLLERLIASSTNYEDLVFDFFMGSGTTLAAAMNLGRRYIGADINLGAVQVATKRLLETAERLQKENLQKDLFSKEDENRLDTIYTGFEVYNVNHYDVFRNPIEARELLLEALEVNKLPQGQLFDGEKDGRMVKIMPVNRIASRADLGELIAGLDLKAFAKRQKANPNDPVEKITLVCMGHEPDLKAHLIKEADPYKLDVEVVDILRDRQDLQFKRDSEAKVVIKSGKLVIERFYPMNLLGKLSLQKEKVKDWKELVESVMIDWNYDGAVLTPTTVDIPEKDELVSGAYPIPKDAGTIRVKITDLLSESLEVEVTNA